MTKEEKRYVDDLKPLIAHIFAADIASEYKETEKIFEAVFGDIRRLYGINKDGMKEHYDKVRSEIQEQSENSDTVS